MYLSGDNASTSAVKEGVDEFVAACDQAGIGNLLKVARHGEWIDWADG